MEKLKKKKTYDNAQSSYSKHPNDQISDFSLYDILFICSWMNRKCKKLINNKYNLFFLPCKCPLEIFLEKK